MGIERSWSLHSTKQKPHFALSCLLQEILSPDDKGRKGAAWGGYHRTTRSGESGSFLLCIGHLFTNLSCPDVSAWAIFPLAWVFLAFPRDLESWSSPCCLSRAEPVTAWAGVQISFFSSVCPATVAGCAGRCNQVKGW